MSPYADGMNEVMLNTSELVFSSAPCGTCHPHEDTFGEMPISGAQYRVMSGVMSVHSWQTASVSKDFHVQVPLEHSNWRDAAGLLFSANKPL